MYLRKKSSAHELGPKPSKPSFGHVATTNTGRTNQVFINRQQCGKCDYHSRLEMSAKRQNRFLTEHGL